VVLCRRYPMALQEFAFWLSEPAAARCVSWALTGRIEVDLLRWCFPSPSGTLVNPVRPPGRLCGPWCAG